MSEEIALAIGDIATIEQLRARVLEWEDCYDRLAGAFDLHMAIGECQQAMSDYAGGFYDVVLGELSLRAEKAEAAQQAWTELGAQLLAELEAARAVVAFVGPNADCPTSALNQELTRLLLAYDEATKARTE